MTCRACSADIFFAITVARGARIPIDAVVPAGIAPNIVLGPRVKGLQTATVVLPGEGTHTTHFATCSAPASFRRRRTKRK